jgi:Lon protease-like protein
VPGVREKRLHAIGCAGRRDRQFSETEDGRYMITLAGMSRFRVQRRSRASRPTAGATSLGRVRARSGPDRDTTSRISTATVPGLLERYLRCARAEDRLGALKEAEDELLINSLSMLCPFEPEDKQALLEAPSLTTRRETLVTLIEFALRGGSNEEVMQ